MGEILAEMQLEIAAAGGHHKNSLNRRSQYDFVQVAHQEGNAEAYAKTSDQRSPIEILHCTPRAVEFIT
jgi:hypothetical protein